MGKLLFIDSDDIETLSEALQEALERRGVRFNSMEAENLIIHQLMTKRKTLTHIWEGCHLHQVNVVLTI